MTKNIYVFEGGGSKPKPLAVIDMGKYSENDSKATSAILYKKINNVFTLEIDIPTNCDASQSITNTSDLVLYDTEGNLQEFHVTELTDLHEYSVIRTVYAEQSISELMEDIITGGVEMPTTTNPADYLAYILSFTRWSVGTVDSSIYNSRWKEDLTGKNCLEALQMFIDKFNCEFTVRYESDNKNRITGRYIDIKKTIGNNYGKRFEDTKDINALKRNLDLDSIKTAIYPRIAKQSNDENGNSTVEYIDISTVEWSVAAGDPVNKPLGQTILVDPDANTMYKRLNSKNGKLQERIMYAEWTEQTAKDAEDLCKQAWRILKANSVIYPSYEVTASDLYKLSGNNSDYAHEQVSLGDTCIIIDRKITPELRATTRVVEIEEDLLNPINNKYVFGKYRQTLATSNVDQQKSIEEKLAELSSRIQGMTIPEVKPQYQSGKVYYEDIKQDIQNEFMSANGYVMAEDSNGFWVMDAPQGGTPTKALILKGGNLAIATYNTVTSAWEVGTFINGTSVNADYINTGHIAADVIAAHSITTEHLTSSAVQYIRTGMATDEDLQGVIDSVANDYATKDSVSSNINNAVKDLVSTSNMNSAITNATKDMATNSSVSNNINNAVKDLVSTSNMNSAISSATKDMATNGSVSSAITNATKDMATNSSVNSAITNATKDMATNSGVNSAINSATKDMATNSSVNSAINNIVIGGRNLFLNSDFHGGKYTPWSSSHSATLTLMDNPTGKALPIPAKKVVRITGGNGQSHGFLCQTVVLETNTYYTVTFWAYVPSNVATGTASVSIYYTNSGWQGLTRANIISERDTWVKKTVTFKTHSTYGETILCVGLTGDTSNVPNKSLYCCLAKLEKGNKATDWTPAPEDVEEQNRITRINAIKDLQKQLQAEYSENNSKANKVYSDQYLPNGSTAKVNLNNKMAAYTTAYNNYNNYITTMIADGTVTEAEYNQYNTYATAYANATKGLAEAIEDANSARLANVYAQARQGLVTTADLEVNNQSVIASAKAGMVSTGDMTSSITAATENLVSNEALNNAINGIEIGGRNIAINTNQGKTGWGWSMQTGGVSTESIIEDGINCCKFTRDKLEQSGWSVIRYEYINRKMYRTNTKYTVSFEVKSSVTSSNNIRCCFRLGDSSGLITDEVFMGKIHTANTWIKLRCTLTTVSEFPANTGQVLYLTGFNGTTGAVYKFRNLKIEEGTKTTAWTPAPEDTSTEISNATKDMATTTIVNTAITNATKNMATNSSVNSAISNATKDMATNSSVNTAVSNATKDKVTNTQMNTAINNATKDKVTNTQMNTAINNATKDKVTNTQMNTAINNATKDMATNSSVNTTVSNATKDMATNAGVTNAINGVVVGSRNLALLTSDDWVSFSDFHGTENDCRLSYKVLTKGLSVNDKLLVAFDYKLENMTYTSGQSPAIRIQGSGDVTQWNSGAFPVANIGLSSKPANASGTVYIIASVNSDHLKNSYWNCNFRTDYITGGTVSIKGIRVIRSSKLVSWIAAPEDAYTNTVFETFKAVTAEYNSNYKIATTLYSNSYLSGTAKTNLKTAYDDYATKYNAVKTAHNAISTNKYADTAKKTAWNTALTNLQSSTTTLAQRVQEATTFINTAVYNASKTYTDKAIPDALTGYAKTSYVDSAKADAIADAKKGMVSTSQLEVNNTEILMKTASMGQYNMLRNSDFRDGMNYWNTWGTDGTEPIVIVRETETVPAAAMSGEKNICIMSRDNASTGNKNLGFFQDTKKCVIGVSYTVGYWINCINCSCKVSIESLDSSGTKSELAAKSYTNINGGHDRATWKYDSITFTVPNGSATIRFVGSLTYANYASHRVLMVKPMLATGINAQAWTAHPDEIHVGVVSVTEERGIMVEHSDTDSYSTLDSDGLKIWEYGKSSPVASFGESNTAYIDTVSTKKLVCDTVIPTIKVDVPIGLYFSSTGSGDYSGKDENNCCAGFTGAMSRLCKMRGIDSTYIRGGFNITGSGGWLNFYGVGTYLDEDIKLQNIYTTAPIKIELPANMVQTGTFDLVNIYGQITITGKRSDKNSNDGCLIKRNGAKDGISIRNCSCVTIEKLRLSNTAKNGTGIAIDVGSTVYVSTCDIYQFFYGIEVGRYSTLFVDYCRGTSGFSGIAVTNSLVVYNGSIPSGNTTNDIDHNIYMYGCSAKFKGTASDANTKPIGTVQSATPVTSKVITRCFSAISYQSTRQYSVTDLYQASWGKSSSFGNYRGNIFFSNSLKNWLSKASGISAQIYLQRQSSKHGNTNAKIKIEGTDVGTLALGEGKWFNVPSKVITGLKEGSLVSIELNGTGNDYYCRFEKNVILKVTATKEV